MVPHHSHRLAGLLPSTSPPPLGERTGHSKRTNSHFDSHTMSDHEPKISNIPYLPSPIWETEPSSTYQDSMGSDHSMAGTSPDDPSQFLGYMYARHRYWLRSPNRETHHAPTSTSTIMYGMLELPETSLAPHIGSGVDPSVVLGDLPFLSM